VREEGSSSTSEATSAARRRRRRRGGRGRSRGPGTARTTTAASEDGEGASGVEPEDAAGTEGSTAPRTASRTRSRRSPSAAAEAGAESAPAPARPAVPARRSRGGASTRSGGGKASATTEPAEEPALRTTRRLRSRTRTTGGRRRREREPEIVRATDKSMLITEIGDRDQIAVLEDRRLVEHFVTRAGARSMVGNIYLAKVQNVLPGMEAAFIDVGRGRNAVLYAGEVSYDEEIDGEAPRIEKVLRGGQNVVVQVTKDPMGGKGARLTQEISLPGRFVVLVPNSKVFGISRRLPEKERSRLKDFLKKIRPPEHGLIVRTAAEGASVEDLQADLERLNAEWLAIEKSAKRGKAPRVLYEEPELTVRVVRDLFTGGEFKEMVTDSVPVHDQVVAYLQSVAPDLVPRVHLHQGPLSVFEEYHVVEQIHKALDRKVWLPSGGYLVIDRTEALTVIDVNTGKHVGKQNLEETVTKTNLEAAEEAAHQLRLRDIGGIIVIDFIDMLLEKNKDKVVDTLKAAMAQDKTRSQVFDIGPLGLAQVTRKRVSAGLLESFSETCPTCEGRGILLTYKA
jgi:ribonuclease E